MAEITYSQFKSYISDDFSPAGVYLIFGEEYLYKSVYQKLIDRIIPEDRREFSLEELAGTDDNTYEAVERVNTFSLDAESKVIGLTDAGIFYSKDNAGDLVQRIKTSVTDGNLKKGADLFIKLLSLMDIDLEDMSADDRSRIHQKDAEATDNDPSWLETITGYCRDRALGPTTVADAVTTLTTAIEKGFAPGNHLLITAENVDKRRKLYKTIKERGVVIDCSVPTRDNRADRAKQETALAEIMRTVLEARGKTMAQDAFNALRNMTGFDLRTFHSSLEKLIAFTGDRTVITASDVTELLKRTKKDPIYELTGALFDRNIPQALFLLDSLLSGAEPLHPLQVIAAIVNQTRKLLVIRDFMDNDQNKNWHDAMPFDAFRKKTLPAITDYDNRIREHLDQQQALLPDQDTGKKPGKRKAPTSDLLISPNPASPFPTYQNFKKAAAFSTTELLAALTALAETDRQLKSSRLDQRLILENLIIRIIRGNP